jgi:general secretion pathway protein H
MNNGTRADAGFTLIEMVCVMAIIGLLTAVLLPSFPRQTSRARLQSYAIQTAALLKADRNAAIRQQQEVTTLVNSAARSVRSGTTGEIIRVPDDVQFDALLPASCNSHPVFASVSFFGSGRSCGGVITLTHLDAGFEIRINWLTGRIDVVSRGRLPS